MRKTVSLVLALAMVFALAPSAFAITGPSKLVIYNTAVPPYTNINLQVVESPDALAIRPIPDNRIFEMGSAVHFALYFQTPDKDDITMANYDYIAPYVFLSSNNVEFDRTTIKLTTINETGGTTYSGGTLTFYETYYDEVLKKKIDIPSRLYARLPDPVIAGPRTHILTGSGVVVGNANGVIRAEIQGVRDCTKFLPLPTTKEIADSVEHALGEIGGGHLINRDKKLLYTVRCAGTAAAGQKITYGVRIMSGTGQGCVINFTTDYSATLAPGSTNNLDKIEIQTPAGFMSPGDPARTYLVNDTGTQVSFTDGAPVPSGPLYNALRAAYNKVMGFFELKVAKAGILLPQHFGYKFSTFYAVNSDNVNRYYNPPTGDNAPSIILGLAGLGALAFLAYLYIKRRNKHEQASVIAP